jgi:hypothetical protein
MTTKPRNPVNSSSVSPQPPTGSESPKAENAKTKKRVVRRKDVNARRRSPHANLSSLSSSLDPTGTPEPEAREIKRKKKAVYSPSPTTRTATPKGTTKVRRVVRRKSGAGIMSSLQPEGVALPANETVTPAKAENAEGVVGTAAESLKVATTATTSEASECRPGVFAVGSGSATPEVDDAFGVLYHAAGDTLDAATVHEMAAELIAKADGDYEPKTKVWGPHANARTSCRSLTPHAWRACTKFCAQDLDEAEHWALDMKAVLDGVLEKARMKAYGTAEPPRRESQHPEELAARHLK